MGPVGLWVLPVWRVLPYKERLGRVQIDPLLQVKRIQHSHGPDFYVCWQHWRFHPSARYIPSSPDVISQLFSASLGEGSKNHVYVLVLFEKWWWLPHQPRTCVVRSFCATQYFPNHMYRNDMQGEIAGVAWDLPPADGWSSRDTGSFLTNAVHHISLEQDEKLCFVESHSHMDICLQLQELQWQIFAYTYNWFF